jgi:preprotein translocase subunit SecE
LRVRFLPGLPSKASAVFKGGVLPVISLFEGIKEIVVAEKIEKAKAPNVLQRYYRETMGEIRKVNWPTTKEALHLTRIVLIVLVVMAVILGLLDYVFSQIIGLILA